MTPAELAAIRSRIEAASPGPWRRDRNNRAKIRDSYGDTIARIVHEANEDGFDAQCEADAAFIVSARSDILALLAHVEAVETERAELRAKLAEAEATLANERGEGEPPGEGWEPCLEVERHDADDGSEDIVTRWFKPLPGLWLYAGTSGDRHGWWWSVLARTSEGRRVCMDRGDAETARSAMRAADLAARGSDAP